MGKLGIFLITTKSFFLNLKMSKLGIFFDNNKIFLPESQKWIFVATTKMGLAKSQNGLYFRNNKRMGLGESQNGVFSV